MRVLFLSADYFGIYEVIGNGIRKYLGYDVDTILLREYRYKNKWEQAINFASKTFAGINLKKKWADRERMAQLQGKDGYDFVFVICPDFIPENDLKLIRQKAKTSIVYFWDSFANIPAYEKVMHHFDRKFSFEPEDVRKHGMHLLTNFYYNTEKHDTVAFDAFFIGTYDERITTIINIADFLKSKGKRLRILVQSRRKSLARKLSRYGIEVLMHRIPITESEEIFKESAIIIDVNKKIQNGLTFRIFEALGHQKKLITTNADIVNYDFYDTQNIYVWKGAGDNIPDSFFEIPYRKLPEEIFRKYSLEHWVKTIFAP